jgi:hypothetical protein
MCIIYDGTTTFTSLLSDESINPVIEKNTKRTAGGNTRSITGGERFKATVKIRETPGDYRSLLNVLNSGADNYYFTPQDSTASWMTSLFPDISFPLNANIGAPKREWDNRSAWYIVFDVESSGYV